MACCARTCPKAATCPCTPGRPARAVDLKLNQRPRSTLLWRTPDEVFAGMPCSTRKPCCDGRKNSPLNPPATDSLGLTRLVARACVRTIQADTATPTISTSVSGSHTRRSGLAAGVVQIAWKRLPYVGRAWFAVIEALGSPHIRVGAAASGRCLAVTQSLYDPGLDRQRQLPTPHKSVYSK
jgi:hypothetical protein